MKISLLAMDGFIVFAVDSRLNIPIYMVRVLKKTQIYVKTGWRTFCQISLKGTNCQTYSTVMRLESFRAVNNKSFIMPGEAPKGVKALKERFSGSINMQYYW